MSTNAWKLDGQSLLPLFAGKNQPFENREFFWRQNGSKGNVSCREGFWKLVWNRSDKDAQPELFNLRRDIKEENNLAEENPGRVKVMLDKINAWEANMKEPIWGGPTAQAQVIKSAQRNIQAHLVK